ncbi:hypothetical protein MMC21_003291 [Puttea exsequens]|nr:hypothetical protein [Puttea exsequens]
MKPSTPLFTILLSLLALLLAPLSLAHPMPNNINKEGRDFNSRFAPIARPVFPRSYFENFTASETEDLPTRSLPLDTHPLAKRDYPAGPTASALVFRSEPMVFAPRYVKEKRTN